MRSSGLPRSAAFILFDWHMTDRILLFHSGRNLSGPWALTQEKGSPNQPPHLGGRRSRKRKQSSRAIPRNGGSYEHLSFAQTEWKPEAARSRRGGANLQGTQSKRSGEAVRALFVSSRGEGRRSIKKRPCRCRQGGVKDIPARPHCNIARIRLESMEQGRAHPQTWNDNRANMEYRSNLERWPRGSGSSGGETPAPQFEGRVLAGAVLFTA